MAANTREHYMLNVRSFLKHMRSTPPEDSRLPTTKVNGLITFLDAMIKSNKKPKIQREHATHNKKKTLLHSREELQSCMEGCSKRIPELLGESLSNMTEF